MANLRPKRLGRLLGRLSLLGLVLLALSFGLAAWWRQDAEARFPRTPEGRRALWVETSAGAQRVLLANSLPRAEQAPAIVLLHGAFGGAEDWVHTVLDAVGERGYALAFDRPGHGYSAGDPRARNTPRAQGAILWQAIDRLEWEQVVLVGFSYGSAVALAMALEAPERVSGMLLIAPASHPWPGSVDLGYQLAGAPLLGPALSNSLLPVLAHGIEPISRVRSFAPNPVPDAFARSPVPLAIAPPRLFANTEDMRRLRDALAEQAAHYPTIQAPLFVLQGAADKIVSPEVHARALLREVPGARLEELEGAGHQLPYTHGLELLWALDQLLRAAGLPVAPEFGAPDLEAPKTAR